MTAPVGTGRALGVQSSVISDIDSFSMSGTGSKAGFFGVSATTQPANAAQATLTTVTGLTAGIGFSTITAFSNFVAQVENIRASLVTLGLLKGGA